jgi:hypothetical protein
VDGRYPDYVNKIGEKTGQVESSKILDDTKEVFAWLLTLKPQKK